MARYVGERGTDMSVELKELVPGAVVVSIVGGKLAVVTAMNRGSAKYPVLYKMSPEAKTTYKGGPADFVAVVGSVDLDKFNAAARKPLFGSSDPGVSSAPWVPRSSIENYMKTVPAELMHVKKGDVVLVKHGASVREVVFEGYNPNRPKYPISYRIHTGGRYKAQLTAFVRKVRDGSADSLRDLAIQAEEDWVNAAEARVS